MEYNISFCTVCMNRLHHLKYTLPANLADNSDYKNLEFILLDYNSSDMLEEYVKNELINYVNDGRLVYYRTYTPAYFNRSHSRNIAFKLATGDIVVNLDADNFTGKHFAAYINNEFNDDCKIYLSALHDQPDVLGRICVKKEDFNKVKGYDERMTSYGYEDYDLINRLEFAGLKNKSIKTNNGYLNAISHDDRDRLTNEFSSSNLVFILLSYLSPASTEMMLFLRNGTYKKGTAIKNKSFKSTEPAVELNESQLKYRFSFLNNSWEEGDWFTGEGDLYLSDRNSVVKKLVMSDTADCFTSYNSETHLDFYKITDERLTEEILMFFSQVINRQIMENNRKVMRPVTNDTGFGKEVVYRNFDNKNAIIV